MKTMAFDLTLHPMLRMVKTQTIRSAEKTRHLSVGDLVQPTAKQKPLGRKILITAIKPFRFDDVPIDERQEMLNLEGLTIDAGMKSDWEWDELASLIERLYGEAELVVVEFTHRVCG